MTRDTTLDTVWMACYDKFCKLLIQKQTVTQKIEDLECLTTYHENPASLRKQLDVLHMEFLTVFDSFTRVLTDKNKHIIRDIYDLVHKLDRVEGSIHNSTDLSRPFFPPI